MSRPPCWPAGQPCPNACAAALHDRTVYNRQHLGGPWSGWRMAGRELVSPDGDRISPERMRGLLWRQQAEERRDAARAAREKRVSRMVTVVRIDQGDWHRERFGTVAG
ncbi:DUF3653 domain-containing protein [Luteimonas sp. SDU82]|uniref:DUF3653 domain-containing protein n=1 Tax=Luteimonas sp. SDU82 TaxID=3422592 RepID=UPI003EBB9CBA